MAAATLSAASPEREQRRVAGPDLVPLVGLAAVTFTAIYFISDVLEVAQGDFSTFRLTLTCIGEAAIPLFVPNYGALTKVFGIWMTAPGRRA